MRKLESQRGGECRRDEAPGQGMGKRFWSTEADANSCQVESVATLDQEAEEDHECRDRGRQRTPVVTSKGTGYQMLECHQECGLNSPQILRMLLDLASNFVEVQQMDERWSDDVDGKKTMVRCVVYNRRVKISSKLSYAARRSST